MSPITDSDVRYQYANLLKVNANTVCRFACSSRTIWYMSATPSPSPSPAHPPHRSISRPRRPSTRLRFERTLRAQHHRPVLGPPHHRTDPQEAYRKVLELEPDHGPALGQLAIILADERGA